jgi:prevent-host-death family protein
LWGENVTQTTVGIRELKAQLSAYLQRVKAGDTVVITERGKVVGRIVPIEPSQPSVEARLQDLIAAGVVEWNGQKLEPMAPVAKTHGPTTVADLLLEDRE